MEVDTYSQSRHVDEYFQQVSCHLDENGMFKVEKNQISQVTLFWENEPYTAGFLTKVTNTFTVSVLAYHAGDPS